MKKIDYIFYFVIGILFIAYLTYIILGGQYLCPIYSNFHIYCPACGISRMIKSIINLNFYQAFRYNQLAFLLIILFVLFFIVKIYLLINNKKSIKLNKNIYLVLLIVIAIYGILRNIEIFSYLAPTMVN